jgi:hypothetical protein
MGSPGEEGSAAVVRDYRTVLDQNSLHLSTIKLHYPSNKARDNMTADNPILNFVESRRRSKSFQHVARPSDLPIRIDYLQNRSDQ